MQLLVLQLEDANDLAYWRYASVLGRNIKKKGSGIDMKRPQGGRDMGIFGSSAPCDGWRRRLVGSERINETVEGQH